MPMPPTPHKNNTKNRTRSKIKTGSIGDFKSDRTSVKNFSNLPLYNLASSRFSVSLSPWYHRIPRINPPWFNAA
ncbi:hypothetical protein ACJIZ3_025034 [Penstemon smallii]|uniref:Uncharacterized protein n=1 Tax=Penstemon smallii TaxID=265156 RepID=A0ABD3TVP8_9LAMI